jgi:DNA-directed RNA polymerase specialized sigma24 family protein
MLSEAHYRTVLNFFYFLLLDEGMALNASYKAIKRANRDLEKESGLKTEVILIRALHAVLKNSLAHKKAAVSTPPQSDWRISKPENALVWREYIRKADQDSSTVLVLRYILGFPSALIAEALGLPEGTVMYRLGRGLEALACSPALAVLEGR